MAAILAGWMVIMYACEDESPSSSRVSTRQAPPAGLQVPAPRFTRFNVETGFFRPVQQDTVNLDWFYAALAKAVEQKHLQTYAHDTGSQHLDPEAPLDTVMASGSQLQLQAEWNFQPDVVYPTLIPKRLAPVQPLYVDQEFLGLAPSFWLDYAALLEKLDPERRRKWSTYLMQYLQHRLHPRKQKDISYYHENEPPLPARHTLRVIRLGPGRKAGKSLIQQLQAAYGIRIQHQLLKAVRRGQIQAYNDWLLENVLDPADVNERLTLEEDLRYQPRPQANPFYERDTIVRSPYEAEGHPYFFILEEWKSGSRPDEFGRPQLKAFAFSLRNQAEGLTYYEPLFWLSPKAVEALPEASQGWLHAYLVFTLQKKMSDVLPAQPF